MAAGDHTVTGTMTANKVAVTDTVVVANLNADQVDGADKDIDGTLAGNSDASVPTEKAVKTYVDTHAALAAAGTHGSTVAATPNKAVHRDAAGRAKVVAPAVAGDIALKSTVTADIATHEAVEVAGTHGSTVAATPNKSVHRDAAGRAKVVAPAAENDIALKSTVTALGNTCVLKTGNQSIGGVKTFTSPIVGDLDGGVKDHKNGRVLDLVELDLGDWNISATVFLNLATIITTAGYDTKKVRSLGVVIRNDDDDQYIPVPYGVGEYSNILEGVVLETAASKLFIKIYVQATGTQSWIITRVIDGTPDYSDWDATSYNRGWITFWYEV